MFYQNNLLIVVVILLITSFITNSFNAFHICHKKYNFKARFRSLNKNLLASNFDSNNNNNNNNNTASLIPYNNNNKGLSFFGAEELEEAELSKDFIDSFKQEVAFIPSGPIDDGEDYNNMNNNNQFTGKGVGIRESESGVGSGIRPYRGKELDNRYFKIVDKLQPNDMLQKFALDAPSNVQEAAKSTIVSILGSLPKYALDASLITTNVKLANLMFQMEVTGYMFKNAEYRMSLTRSLKGLPRLTTGARVSNSEGNTSISLSDVGATNSGASTTIEGQVTLRSADGQTIEIPAAQLTASLSAEVDALKKELAIIRNDRESDLRSNLLTYIQALPERDLSRLTSDMSDDVMEAIQLLVDALMERLGVDVISQNGEEVVIQQSVGVLAQLCMWQMVVGYKLRELEALDKGVPLD